jgi:low affinity Fe/Cu permease
MKKKKKSSKFAQWFEKFSGAIIKFTGTPMAFFIALFVIVAWAISGPVFKFSDTWQLVINTSTTIITFLMVFIIQQSQNKDTMALQLKLNELIASEKHASNRLINVEDISQEELDVLKRFYVKLAKLAKEENDIHSSHSVDEAQTNHEEKKGVK